jgi:hypothetical protein
VSMKKKIIFFALVVILITAIIIPAAVKGAVGGTAGDSAGGLTASVSAEVHFPLIISFDVSAQGSALITDIRLHYTVAYNKLARVVSEGFVTFTSGTVVTTRYNMDLRQTGGLPPGSRMTYWVTVKDASGAVTETLPQNLEIKDERYSWKLLQSGMISLYWYTGSDDFAQELMDAAQTALGRLAENTGAALENPVSLYIYASSSDLIGALIFAQDWTGGIAFSEFGIIAIGISADQLDWGKRTISHELTHLVVYQATQNPYNGPPPWLNEGLAMFSEGDLEYYFTGALEDAEKNNSLISVQSLCSPFSAYTDQAVLAYAESYEIVKYLIDTYGREKMFELLSIYREGTGYDEALKAVYGFDMQSLNTQWQAALKVLIP